MIKLLKLLFGRNKNDLSSVTDNQDTETKKCMRCLRRVILEKARCPFCGCSDFHIQ